MINKILIIDIFHGKDDTNIIAEYAKKQKTKKIKDGYQNVEKARGSLV